VGILGAICCIYHAYTGGDIAGLLSPKKTYAISRFLDKILPVSISPNFFEIYISDYFEGVMNDVILMIEFPKFTLFNFYLIAFCGVLNPRHFGNLFYFNLKIGFIDMFCVFRMRIKLQNF
jgi:hypothetical protein